MAKINWTTYIAANNPNGVNYVLNKYGYPDAENENELIQAIDILQNEQGNKSTIDLLKEHPEYDIIVETYKQSNQYRNALGDEETNTKPEETKEQPVIKVSSEVPNHFSATLKDVILVVMAFWLINKIISK
jgi:uncharacterized protein YqfA (UPF0365 family)